MVLNFVIGFLIGGYTAAMIREEYYFPTLEKINHSFKIYKQNEASIEKAIINTTKANEKF